MEHPESIMTRNQDHHYHDEISKLTSKQESKSNSKDECGPLHSKSLQRSKSKRNTTDISYLASLNYVMPSSLQTQQCDIKMRRLLPPDYICCEVHGGICRHSREHKQQGDQLLYWKEHSRYQMECPKEEHAPQRVLAMACPPAFLHSFQRAHMGTSTPNNLPSPTLFSCDTNQQKQKLKPNHNLCKSEECISRKTTVAKEQGHTNSHIIKTGTNS